LNKFIQAANAVTHNEQTEKLLSDSKVMAQKLGGKLKNVREKAAVCCLFLLTHLLFMPGGGSKIKGECERNCVILNKFF
jgi:hypothetical protein